MTLLTGIELIGNENQPGAFTPASSFRACPAGRWAPKAEPCVDLWYISCCVIQSSHQLVEVFWEPDSIMKHIAYMIKSQLCVTCRFLSAFI